MIQDLKEFNIGDRGNVVWKTIVVLNSKITYLDTRNNITWKARFGNCKLEILGPPNHYFLPKNQITERKNVGLW